MATFEAQVEGQTGLSIDGSSSPTQDELTQFLKDGVIDVTNRCLSINPREKDNFSRESAEQTSNGVNVGSSEIISVIREDGTNNQWYPCRKESIGLQYKVTDTSSLHYASKYNPVYMITQNRNVHVYPAPSASGNDTFKVLYINYDPEESDGTDLQYDSTAIKWFPDDKVYLVIVYSSIKSLENSLSAKSLPDAITFPIIPASVSLSTVSTSLPSFTAPGAFVSPASLADADVSFSEVGNFPSYVSPSFSSPTLGSVGSLTLPSVPVVPSLTSNSVSFSTSAPSYNEPVLSLTTFPTITWSFPSVPVAPSISAQTVADFSGSAPTYTQPVLALGSTPTMSNLTISSSSPVTPSLSSNSISFSTTAPTYTQPLVSLGDAPTISNLSISVSTPTVPVISSTSVSFSSSAPTYAQPVLLLGSTPTISDLSISVSPPVPPETASFTSPSIDTTTISNLGVPPSYTAPKVGGATEELTASIEAATAGEATDKYDFSRWFDLVADYIEDEEDIELAQAQIQKINSYIQAYSGAMQNKLNEFNDANAEYQGKLQESIQQAQINAQRASQQTSITLQKENQEYGTKIQKYSNELQSYQQQVNKEVQEYQQNLEGDLRVWQTERQTDLQKYTGDIQNNLNSFNQSNVKYQADLQVAIQNAQLSQSDDGQILQKYSSEVQIYQSEVSKEVQEYQQNLEGDLKVWQSERQTDLQKYASDIQNNLNKFNESNVAYQANLQISIQDAQLSQNDDEQKLKKHSNEIQFYQTEVSKEVQQYQQNLEGDLKVWQSERQTDIQKFSADIQNAVNLFNKENVIYQATVQEKIQEAQLADSNEAKKLQKFQQETGNYQAEVNKIVNGNKSEIDEWQSRNAVEMQKYGSDIQNRLNTFNKENVEYQAQLQISIQNAQLSQADDGQQLQKYSSNVGLYQAEVNSKIQEWINEEWNQNFLKYQNDYASLLKEYGTDIQSESERVKNDVQNYQQKVAKALQTYQAETGYDIAKLNADIQKESQRFTQDLAKQVTSYKSDLEKYQAETGKINQDNQSKIAKFNAEVQSFSAELTNKVQEFTSRLQKSVTDYGWMESRMKNLKEQYNNAFTIMAGAVQQQQQPTAPPEQQGQQQQYRR